MCMSSPDIPEPKPVQESKPADTLNAASRKRAGMTAGGGTLLTGPSGVLSGSNNLAGGTLLGS